MRPSIVIEQSDACLHCPFPIEHCKMPVNLAAQTIFEQVKNGKVAERTGICKMGQQVIATTQALENDGVEVRLEVRMPSKNHRLEALMKPSTSPGCQAS